jgi:tRNA-specific 2-thiouridylase
MKINEVYVSSDLQDENLWSNEITFTSAHWINDVPKVNQNLFVRTRHRAKLIPVESLNKLSGTIWSAKLKDEVRALTPGQSAVFYSGAECIGSGVLS